MSLTVAALGAAGESVVSGVDSIGKSFPQFFEKLQQLGAQIE
jgi:UDP-N-acetylglucosamine enolpyruvyl transferase